MAEHTAVTGLDDYAYASALDDMEFLQRRTRRVFRCAGAVGQLEAVRAGAGIGILHDSAAVDRPELVRILPGVVFERADWLTAHLADHEARRIRACRDFIVQRVREERERLLPNSSSTRS